jgi:predicted N-acyltransferase
VAPPAVARVLNVISKILPQAGYQRTLFVGSPCSEEGTIGLVPDVELKDIVGPLASAVTARARLLGAPMVVFKDCSTSIRGAMEEVCLKQNYFHMHSYPGTAMNLPGADIESYFAALTRTRRHNFKKKLRRSKEELELITTFVKRPTDEELVELFALFMQTYEKGKTKFEKLSIEFFARIRETDPAWFILQRDKASGKLLTFMLVFKLGDRFVNKFIGLDYSRGGNSFLYFRQFEAALNFAYEHGMSEFQSGQTGYRAKLDLGHELVVLHNYCHHGNAIVNAIYARLARDITLITLDPDLLTYLTAHKEKAKLLVD